MNSSECVTANNDAVPLFRFPFFKTDVYKLKSKIGQSMEEELQRSGPLLMFVLVTNCEALKKSYLSIYL
jgi:hypothetical protein